MSNNAAEHTIRPLPLGHKTYLFAGSDNGGRRAPVIYTITQAVILNGPDPAAYLRDTLARIAAAVHPAPMPMIVPKRVEPDDDMAVMDRISHKYIGADFPMRDAFTPHVQLIVDVTFSRYATIPFEHNPPR